MDATKVSTVEQTRQQLLEKIKTLPAGVLQELAEFVSQLHQREKASDTEEILEEAATNPYEDLKDLIGCGEGPADLSTNYKAYLREGFGSDRDHR
ncbi:MAG: hypothetical protein AAFY54_13920 [Cyanobacteria bacterium J06648_10]